MLAARAQIMGRAQKRRHAAEKAAAYEARGLQEGWWKVEGPWPAEEPAEGAQADVEEAMEEAIPTAGLFVCCWRELVFWLCLELAVGSLQICKSANLPLFGSLPSFLFVSARRELFLFGFAYTLCSLLLSTQCKCANMRLLFFQGAPSSSSQTVVESNPTAGLLVVLRLWCESLYLGIMALALSCTVARVYVSLCKIANLQICTHAFFPQGASGSSSQKLKVEETIPTAGLLVRFCLLGESWYSGFAFVVLLLVCEICKYAHTRISSRVLVAPLRRSPGWWRKPFLRPGFLAVLCLQGESWYSGVAYVLLLGTHLQICK